MKSPQSLTPIVSGDSPSERKTDGDGGYPKGQVLLEKGLPVFEPRCSVCGRTFDPPRRSGEKFKVALQFLQSGPAEKRLFVGNKVLIANTNGHLSPLLDRSTTFVGERVLVATPWVEGDANVLMLFCARCGENVTSRTSDRGRDHYAWDWLAEFEPHRLIRSFGALKRWTWRARRWGFASDDVSETDQRSTAPAAALHRSAIDDAAEDARVRAHLYVRDVLFRGPCRLRALRVRALREQVSIKEIENALKTLGAVYRIDADGEKVVIPPVELFDGWQPPVAPSLPERSDALDQRAVFSPAAAVE